jgi:hypothetical protein
MNGVWSRQLGRIASGLSLLLLGAAQEKLCPRPTFRAPQPKDRSAPLDQPRANPAAPPQSGDMPRTEESTPTRLAAALPDAITPRWPGRFKLVPLRGLRDQHNVRPADSSTGGREDESAPSIAGAEARRLRCLLADAAAPRDVADARALPIHAENHAMGTVITAQGPPLA